MRCDVVRWKTSPVGVCCRQLSCTPWCKFSATCCAAHMQPLYSAFAQWHMHKSILSCCQRAATLKTHDLWLLCSEQLHYVSGIIGLVGAAPGVAQVVAAFPVCLWLRGLTSHHYMSALHVACVLS